MLPDGTMLRAVGFEEDEYPGICIYARSPGKPPAIICLTEYNPEKKRRAPALYRRLSESSR